MKVTLIDYTRDAMSLLLRTKNTRLTEVSDPDTWDDEKRQAELDYMRDTIKSSWEFVDFTFEIEGVTRAFTHQLVRTRTGSYAQQSMRAADFSAADIVMPGKDNTLASLIIWVGAANRAQMAYTDMVTHGMSLQDARGILPINVSNNIIAKFNLRTLHEMAKVRLCTRTQGEYQEVFRAMRQAVIDLYPWTSDFLDVHCVATGTCAFPRYGKTSCPVYLPEMDVTETKRKAAAVFWAIRHEADPAAGKVVK